MAKVPTTRVDENGRICTRCHEYKPWVKFNIKSDGLNGHNSQCKKCQNKYEKKCYKEYGNEKKRDEKYCLFPGQFEAMVESQDGKCKICGVELVLKGQQHNSVNVDHCEKTMKVRGLLCRRCNLWLGACKENVCALARAIIYLNNEGEI